MDFVSIIISLFVLLFAITVHEAAHGWAAWKMGDPTAYALGRVSLNPVAHIDLFGTIILPILLVIMHAPAFGWAKPVPVDPRNLRNPRRDNMWISLAGPASNFSVAAISMAFLFLLKVVRPGTTQFLRAYLLQGQRVPAGFYPIEGLTLILFYGILVNTYLGVFNLIPIPPLDGSGILLGLLSDRAARSYDRLRPFGMIIVLLLVSFGVLDIITRPLTILLLTLVFF